MPVVGFVPEPEAAPNVVAWTKALTRDDETDEYVCHEIGTSSAGENAVRAALAERGDTESKVTSVRDPSVVAAVLERCRSVNALRLVTSTFDLKDTGQRAQTSEVLVRSSPCQTFCSVFGGKRPPDVGKILVVMNKGSQDRTALAIADHLSRGGRAKVTVATVEDDTGARAEQAGERALRALLHEAALEEDERFETKVVVDRIPHRGVQHCFDGHDLILTGRENYELIRPLRLSVGDATAAIVKRDPPLRLRALPDWLPRINPSDHADLLQDLRQGSAWGPDFIAMLGLASAIATLGLLQNSPAVVIGSMLLAPLMTPMIGSGLSVVQANAQLARTCGKSIVFGFLLTLGVSFGVAALTPTSDTLSPETLSRGGPNVLDLLIALFAAVAATFAMARPNLSGAIAGVAIATALVPPVCALGISLEHRDFVNAGGASVLFATNLVGIIVASTATFAFLGVTPERARPRYRRWARLVFAALVVLLGVLAAPLSFQLTSQIEVGRSEALTFPVTRAVSEALFDFVDRDEDVDITFLARSSVKDATFVHIASRRELPPAYAENLRKIVRDVRGDPTARVIVIAVRGLWRSEFTNDPADVDAPDDASASDSADPVADEPPTEG